jgi:two-component system, chemotaxis family, protein-glutamate methylesterase/glutaminase
VRHSLEGSGERPHFRVVVVGASAGGLTAIAQLLTRLPLDFPLPLAVVQHIDPNHVSLIADILGRRTKLPVKQAEAHDILTPGVVYVAPPGCHMVIVAGGAIQLTHTEPVHFVRPSADELFESAARSFGPAIAVILSGCGADGATGATAVKALGGIVIVQDEATSTFFGMPQAAIDSGAVDYVLPLDDIAARLVNLAGATRHDGIG